MGREGKGKTRKDNSATTGKATKRKRGKGNIRRNNENKKAPRVSESNSYERSDK